MFCLMAVKSHAGPIVTTVDLSGNLANINIELGQVENMIGHIGFDFRDLAYAPNNELYGITLTELYKIDPLTAQITLIGSHGIADATGLVFNSDGTLYASSASDTYLYEIDPLTAAHQQFVDMGYSSLGDLAILNDQIYSPTPTYQLLQLSLNNMHQINLLDYIPPLYGLIANDDGWLYGFYRDQAFQIDPLTGQNTLYSTWSNQGLEQIVGAAMINESASVSIGNTFVLLLLGLMLITLKRPKILSNNRRESI